mmetsp:Transcript_56923/g.133483  ORF Transcript_56923/g.133483 Transcript_56923/m.133483 type:complete len:638 (+) Transcript_56923:268-2181(+)
MNWGLSFDVVSEARNQRNMLRAVHTCGQDLYAAGKELDTAIESYEHVFMPRLHGALAGKRDYEVPSIEVAWVWHLHKLDPIAYRKDCLAAFGVVLFAPSGTSPFRFSPDSMKEDGNTPASTFSISCNVRDCAKRQSAFLWQVMGIKYEDKEFLDAAVLRYVMMLGLMRKHPKSFIVPTYDMDLMWHTHLAFPHFYAADCDKFAGTFIGHDDSVNDRTEGSKLNLSAAQTRMLYFKAYGCPWEKTGGMYNGEPPAWYWLDRPRAAATQWESQEEPPPRFWPEGADYFDGGIPAPELPSRPGLESEAEGLTSASDFDRGQSRVTIAGAAFGPTPATVPSPCPSLPVPVPLPPSPSLSLLSFPSLLFSFLLFLFLPPSPLLSLPPPFLSFSASFLSPLSPPRPAPFFPLHFPFSGPYQPAWHSYHPRPALLLPCPESKDEENSGGFGSNSHRIAPPFRAQAAQGDHVREITSPWNRARGKVPEVQYSQFGGHLGKPHRPPGGPTNRSACGARRQARPNLAKPPRHLVLRHFAPVSGLHHRRRRHPGAEQGMGRGSTGGRSGDSVVGDRLHQWGILLLPSNNNTRRHEGAIQHPKSTHGQPFLRAPAQPPLFTTPGGAPRGGGVSERVWCWRGLWLCAEGG